MNSPMTERDLTDLTRQAGDEMTLHGSTDIVVDKELGHAHLLSEEASEILEIPDDVYAPLTDSEIVAPDDSDVNGSAGEAYFTLEMEKSLERAVQGPNRRLRRAYKHFFRENGQTRSDRPANHREWQNRGALRPMTLATDVSPRGVAKK